LLKDGRGPMVMHIARSAMTSVRQRGYAAKGR
jgi:hypothetical protein